MRAVVLERYGGPEVLEVREIPDIRSGASVVSLMIMVPTVVLMLIAERFMKTEHLSAGFGKMQ